MGIFGAATDLPIIGDWNSDGKDQIGIRRDSEAAFYLDYDGDLYWSGLPDDQMGTFGLPGDKPLIGNWGP